MMLQKKSSGMARAKSLLVLPLLCTAVLAFAEIKYVPAAVSKDSETSQNVIKIKDEAKTFGKAAQIKDGVFGLPLKGSNVLYVLDGKVVKSIDNFDADKIQSITVIQDKEKMKQFGPEAEGKDAVITLTLKPYEWGNVLFVVDGKIVESIDDIAPDRIESVTVVKYKKQIEKYGKAAEGKEGVIEVKLKSEK